MQDLETMYEQLKHSWKEIVKFLHGDISNIWWEKEINEFQKLEEELIRFEHIIKILSKINHKEHPETIKTINELIGLIERLKHKKIKYAQEWFKEVQHDLADLLEEVVAINTEEFKKHYRGWIKLSEVDEFTKRSTYKETLYHGTYNQFLIYIEKYGLQVTYPSVEWVMRGASEIGKKELDFRYFKGIYLTTDIKTFREKPEIILNVKIKVKKLLVRDSFEFKSLNDQALRYGWGYYKEQWKKTLFERVICKIQSDHFVNLARKSGYDGLINKYPLMMPGFGGKIKEIIIWDPKNVGIFKVEY